jgi:hypothetical protein
LLLEIADELRPRLDCADVQRVKRTALSPKPPAIDFFSAKEACCIPL